MVCIFDDASARRLARALEDHGEHLAEQPPPPPASKEPWHDRALRDACASARAAGVREVAALIAAGADLNAPNVNGKVALHHAAQLREDTA
eukprot:6604288-Prymnesium_polylepis.2